jgi:hypothetical protein
MTSPMGRASGSEYGVANVLPAVLFLPCRPDSRESVPPKTASLVPGTKTRPRPDDRLNSSRDGRPHEVLRLAQRTGDRQTGNVGRVSTNGVQEVLAMEAAPARPSGATEESPRPDLSDGSRRPNVERGKGRKRVIAETGNPSLGTNRRQVSGTRQSTRTLRPTLDNLRLKPRERDCASYGLVDSAAVSRVSGVRSSLPIRHLGP